jgi:hypothetical protein
MRTVFVTKMVSFYKKLAVADSPTMLSGAYPSASSRLNMAQILAIIFSHQKRLPPNPWQQQKEGTSKYCTR